MSDDSLPLGLPLWRLADDSCEATTLYRELRKPLLRYLVSLGLSSDEAQDVVQDAFVSLQRHLAAGGSQENIRSWVFRVAHNQARNRRTAIIGVLGKHLMATLTRSRMRRHPSRPCWRKKSLGS